MTDQDRQQILLLLAEVEALQGALTSQGILERRRLHEELDRERRRLAAQLAQQRGWRATLNPFTFEYLATQQRVDRNRYTQSHVGLIDHPDHFRELNRPYRPVALLTHSYTRSHEQFVALARPHGLAVEFLDWSWYSPEYCTAALFIRM